MIAKRGLLKLLALVALGAGAWFVIHTSVIPEVPVVPVRRGIAILSATGNVTVLPSLDGRVVAPAQGILVKFNGKEGEAVKKGDIIAEIDQGNWPFLLKEARLELERVNRRLAEGFPEEIELDKMRKAYAKNEELAKAGGIPSDTMESARRDIERAEFSLRQARNDLEFNKTKIQNKIDEITQEIARRTVRAGYDGIIMAPAVLQGDLIMNGAGLCNITSRSKAIKAEINQDDLDAVRKSRKVIVKLFSHGDKSFVGTLSKILPIGNDRTQRFTVFIDIPDIPDDVLSGQTGEATFIADEHPGTLLLPRSALMGSECFLLNGENLVKRRVKLGYTTLNDAEVLSGLAEGDLVVAKDPDLRRDKEKVKPVPLAAVK